VKHRDALWQKETPRVGSPLRRDWRCAARKAHSLSMGTKDGPVAHQEEEAISVKTINKEFFWVTWQCYFFLLINTFVKGKLSFNKYTYNNDAYIACFLSST
jgi:hypothetical protein